MEFKIEMVWRISKWTWQPEENVGDVKLSKIEANQGRVGQDGNENHQDQQSQLLSENMKTREREFPDGLYLVFQWWLWNQSTHAPGKLVATYRKVTAGLQSGEPAWKSSGSALSAPLSRTNIICTYIINGQREGISIMKKLFSPGGSSCSSSQWPWSPPTPRGWGRCRRGRSPQGQLCSLHLLWTWYTDKWQFKWLMYNVHRT